MILILATSFSPSVCKVISWLRFYGAEYCRINTDDTNLYNIFVGIGEKDGVSILIEDKLIKTADVCLALVRVRRNQHILMH